jgi:hypothetical protein
MGAALKLKKPSLKAPSFVSQHLPRRPRAINDDRRPCKEIAAERVREFLWELGAEVEYATPGWKAYAIKKAGLHCYHTGWAIIQGEKTTIGPDVIDQISAKTGCPVGVFYDEVR